MHDVNYTVEGEMKKSVHEGKTRIRESLRSQSMTSKLESRRDEEAKEDAVDTRSRQEEGALSLIHISEPTRR